ncbi:exopolysaccharide Pel transporter PelG [Paenibacillus thermoaerophilus]|uniref:Exopolysaccharide Pel transporter PelG n=1 Tax=Paenibacillus thermoaerophilus TaxID=1215385 RepID=A0ABW2V4A1_9BACL|nr:exopolysaccharide Pel transporter PelG [Paenibacillus thermoaerophilus]TMV11158.1 hypothetical protein FE781_12830 [Paenibacillus thermoaerophilus]
MAGIGFELRKLFREQGLVHNVKAYAYSSLTTVGPMILCMFLIAGLRGIMKYYDNSYTEWELYIATVSYCFVFSIVSTSGISMVLTRYVADMIYQKKYDRLMSSYYGSLIVMLPLTGAVAWLFVGGVSAGPLYKLAAYLFFMELVVIWLQGVYLSALKDYIRIVRGFVIGAAVSLLIGWLLFLLTELQPTTAALAGIDIGFFVIAVLSFRHFEQRFPRGKAEHYFEFAAYFRKYPSLFFAGCFVYSGVYLHNFVYWFGADGVTIADRFRVMPFFDLPVFYAFISVMPTLVTFVVSVETSFYEKFRSYYVNVLNEGTIDEIRSARSTMQKVLMREISFLLEVQLVFTVLALALGNKLLPKIGFTMAQLDLFNILVLAYFFYIVLFVLTHILMYFDDRKGVLLIGGLFVVLNMGLTVFTMRLGYDGLGMFAASFLSLAAASARLLYVLRNIDYFTFCSQPINQSEATRKKTFFKKPRATLSVLLLLPLILAACSANGQESGADDDDPPPVRVATGSGDRLTEDKRVYERDTDNELKTLYITILPDKSGSGQPLDWYGLNRLPSRMEDGKLDIIVQEGAADGSGPKPGMFGYGEEKANASITLRGSTAWYAPQKSYRIKLNEEAGLWLDQRTLNLNKHSSDLSRLRNKLSFDLFERIPDISSLRTQFIHLYVKDLTTGNNPSAAYEDYGLYTHVEQPNRRFLQSHMLDPNGYLYKVVFFEFQRYPDKIKQIDDPDYDKKAFEQILEIKGREDHDKLIRMLEDVNNPAISIETVIQKHFDLDNFLTWTAANILMDNMDTDANNFYLYSPLNSDKWYFLPWDYDGAWELQRNNTSLHPYQNGLSNYWGSVLHNRYFRDMSHVQQLKDKMNELAKIINKENIMRLLDSYSRVVEPFLYRQPDMNYLPGRNQDFKKELQTIADTPERALARFLEDLEKPKPFYQDDVVQEDGKLIFTWGLAFDLQGDELAYDVSVSKDPRFTQVVAGKSGLKENRLEIPALPAGMYYWKVTVRDSGGHEQNSFDYYLDGDGEYHFGMREFEVK